MQWEEKLLKLLRLWIRKYNYVNIKTQLFMYKKIIIRLCLSSIFQTLGKLAGWLADHVIKSPILALRGLTLRLLMSYIYGAPSKARNANVVYTYGPTFGNAGTVSFYLLHNVSTLNQCREVSCVTFVCKHSAS